MTTNEPESADLPLPWRVFQLSDYEWWIARTLEEAIADSMKESGCGPEGYEDAAEVSDEAMDRLKFIENPELPREDWVRRTFREELARRAASDEPCDRKPGLFASTEW
jgi:hypothetical protein